MFHVDKKSSYSNCQKVLVILLEYFVWQQIVDVDGDIDVDDHRDIVQLVDDLPEHDGPPVPRDQPGDDVGRGPGHPGPTNCRLLSTQWGTRSYAGEKCKILK